MNDGPRFRGAQTLAKLAELDALDEKTRDQVREKIGPRLQEMEAATRASWLPLECDVAMNRALFDVGAEQLVRGLCRTSILASLNGPLLGPIAQGTVRLFGVSPQKLYKMVPRSWSQLFRGCGTVRVEPDGEHGTKIFYEGLPPLFFERGYAEGVAGGLEALIDFVNGSGSVEIQRRDAEAAVCVLASRWDP